MPKLFLVPTETCILNVTGIYITYQNVIDTLGVADFTEFYQVKEQEIKVLYFRTQRIHKDGLTTKDECTYLHFENGILTDTGEGKSYKRLMAM
ncbi:DUF3192 domain-containing protein [Colwellia sp. UCD-KL20]|uniref:DUF3192 domain-containing protein n=1 Tax=Colwellia sp. UCD-KL20 TaxID=1917165 RepID=UPI0015C32E8E|nr:DUF3192 domain-containing protein [Colwellia sp. UCD-KL20]